MENNEQETVLNTEPVMNDTNVAPVEPEVNNDFDVTMPDISLNAEPTVSSEPVMPELNNEPVASEMPVSNTEPVMPSEPVMQPIPDTETLDNTEAIEMPSMKQNYDSNKEPNTP